MLSNSVFFFCASRSHNCVHIAASLSHSCVAHVELGHEEAGVEEVGQLAQYTSACVAIVIRCRCRRGVGGVAVFG